MILVAALAGFGAAIVLVEKKNQWPATAMRPFFSRVLGKISSKLPEMLECTVCTSFWTSSVCFIYISLITNNLWQILATPICGLVGIAITWTVIETMNALDPK
jgi:hypothetical protein